MESEVEKVVVVYEEHRSRGLAKTEWYFDPAPLTEPEFVGGGTHRKYLAIFVKGTKATCIRISNRGNIRIKQIVLDGDYFLNFLGDVFVLPKKYMDYAKIKGLYP